MVPERAPIALADRFTLRQYNGAEFMHSNATQGIGIGYNSLYAAGSFANHQAKPYFGTGGGIGTA